MLLKLVLCSGLWVMVFAESSDTSSVDDSNDTPSKLNAEFIKSRSAGRDMSYSSSFGSEDFDSPDIPSDFHARWGANKSWYVKTPHPILSRRETYEEYGQAPVVLDSADSSEPDPTEASATDGQTPVTLYNTIENLVSIPNEASATDGQTPVTLNNAIENPVSIPYNAEEIPLSRPTMKWRIRGRVRQARPFQRTYVNFRMRPPPNVGRSFGPPDPPFPLPQHQFRPNLPFAQRPYPRFPPAPFPPYPPRPPPPPPFGPMHHFGQVHPPSGAQGPGPFGPPPPNYQPPSPPSQDMFRPPFASHPGVAPPSPMVPPTYPGSAVGPFLSDIPTISPVDNEPAPWPRRQMYQPAPASAYNYRRVPDFLMQEPKNLSGYKGPRRGKGYEQFGKMDLRPRQVRYSNDFPERGPPPKFPARRGAGFGAEFQDGITRPGYVPGNMFDRRDYVTPVNKFGYAPYRRTADRRRPYGFGRFADDRPPVLGDFGEFRPYRKLDNTKYVPFNYSRPTRSYTFPPRLRLAIRNASYHRRTFRRSGYRGYTLPTLPSIGLEANMAHDHDYYGNLITPKGRIMNLQDLRKLFMTGPDGEAVNASAVNAETLVLDQSIDERRDLKPKFTPKPKGMTAREAMRSAAREAIREAEAEAWEAGETRRGRGRGRGGWRGVGGSGGRGGAFIRRGGARGSGRNFRRAKRSVGEEEWSAQQLRLQSRLT